MALLSFLLYLIVAASCAYIGERIVPGSVPGGFVTSAIVGIIGAWLGTGILGSIGPGLAGVALVPCIMGSAMLIFVTHFFFHGVRSCRMA